MEKMDVVSALAALAQDNRLDVFRLLVQAGPDGMPAGQVDDCVRHHFPTINSCRYKVLADSHFGVAPVVNIFCVSG